MARHRGHHLAIRTCRCRRQLSRYQPARPGSVSAATPSRKGANQRRLRSGEPALEQASGHERRPAPAIRAGPPMRRTGAAAQTAAAQVGKRCQLSNGTRHSCIIAHTYDNVPGVAWPAVPLGFPAVPGPQASISGHCGQGRDRTADLPLSAVCSYPTELPGQPSTPGGCGRRDVRFGSIARRSGSACLVVAAPDQLRPLPGERRSGRDGQAARRREPGRRRNPPRADSSRPPTVPLPRSSRDPAGRVGGERDGHEPCAEADQRDRRPRGGDRRPPPAGSIRTRPGDLVGGHPACLSEPVDESGGQ